ncbi:MAG TPA: HemK/PrmC family methyltransferase [Verrucomicrobiae bacterium]|nr:HemK/PrmC family methyltransferase [Verrucomicrobiae bacterium]
MTTAIWLHYAIEKLETAGITTARLDSQVLLADEMKQNRAWVLAHMDVPVTEETQKRLEKLVGERANHVPLAYIRGKTEFYGREFLIDRRVLEPRPESETMIDVLKKLPIGDNPLQIVDVGTGSGALAITAKLELPKATVTAIDIDPGCLVVAQANADKYRVDIDFRQGDLLQPLGTEIRELVITLANLPYVPDSHQVNQAAMHEPKLAIFGGPDGLDPYRKLFEQAAELSQRPAYILTESLPPQHRQLALIGARFGFRQTIEDDFIQVFEGGHRQGVAYSPDAPTVAGQPPA